MHTQDPGTPLDPSVVPTAVAAPNGNTAPRRPEPPTTLFGRVMALLHGDKYMMNAYPPQWREPGETSPAAPEAGISSREPS